MKTSKNDIGRAFNKAFDDFTVEPNTDLWAKIEKENIAPKAITPTLSTAKFAASMAVIIGITVITYFILSIGINQIVNKNKTPETIIAPARDLPTQTIVEKKEITPIDTKESEIANPQKNITNEELVEKTTPIIIIENAKKLNTPINNIKPTKEEIIIPIKSKDIEIVKVEEEFIQPEIELVQQIIPKETELIIESENEIKNNVDSLKVVFGDNKVICFGEDAILEVEDGYKYMWSNGAIGNKVKVSPTENSFYSVTVSNDIGQKSIHTYSVNIDRTCSALFIPSAFTPNGDGQNDFFKAEGKGVISMKMYVYDKYGSKVFEANNIDDTWDGVYNGQQQGAGMFFYVAEYVDAKGYSHIKKGQVTIIK